MSDVPTTVLSLLLGAQRFQIEVRLSKGFDTWVPIGESVEDFFEGAARAVNLMVVWNPPGDARVLAVE